MTSTALTWTDHRSHGTEPSGFRPPGHRAAHNVLNDVHSRLNATRLAEIVDVGCVEDVTQAIRQSHRDGLAISIAGGRHAMGGQQYGTGNRLLDMRGLDRILEFDPRRGRIRVEAGIQWPELIRGYLVRQHGWRGQWGIRQKQTGADRLSIGGSVAANIHGRGLSMRPFIDDIVELTIVDADGCLRKLSRSCDPEWFSLVVGGYGLFGVVVDATLQLAPRRKIQRIVEVCRVGDLMGRFHDRIAAGDLYGDFQFAIDPRSEDFLRTGILSSYRPVDPATPIPRDQIRLSKSDWSRLLHLAHTDKTRAFEEFRDFYLQSSGQLYWSDTHQLSIYLDDYHGTLDESLKANCRSTEIITELYVEREDLEPFLEAIRRDFRTHAVDLVYGTVRLIEQDRESFMPWARRPYACVIFNLHTEHTPAGIMKSCEAFRRLTDLTIAFGGSYFLTYHRFATRSQLLACHPEFPEFLRLKESYDPEGIFQSDWYRHYR